jgi:hypothetical protein
MKRGNYRFTKWQLATILLLGTAVRFAYGFYAKTWLAAPDQLAWGLDIDAMLHSKAWSYTQLAHAPHEGGSFLISLISLLFRPLQFLMPPLSFAALAIDTVSRFIQVRITQKLFGSVTALCFGVWTILSVPLLLPWGIVNFGLHSLVSFIPFVFFYFALVYKDNKFLPVIFGIITGIAVSFSYDSIILIPASILFLVLNGKNARLKLNELLLFLGVSIIVLLPHVFTRLFLYSASSLHTEHVLAVRGVPFDVFTITHIKNLCTVWFSVLPGSFLLSSPVFLSPNLLRLVVFFFLFAGMAFYLVNRSTEKNEKWLAAGMVLLFVTAYAFSPFYGGSYSSKSYVYYRHLCYIIPFLTVLIVHGFLTSGKFKWYFVCMWLILCGGASIQYMISTQPVQQPAYKAAGWILAMKYGGNINKLRQIDSATGIEYQNELLFGFGWGLSADIFKNRSDSAAVEQLVHAINEYPLKEQPVVIEGVWYSFNKGITPLLDQRLPVMLEQRLSKK